MITRRTRRHFMSAGRLRVSKYLLEVSLIEFQGFVMVE